MKRIAEIIDRLGNINATLKLPLPSDLHLTAARSLLPEIEEELKQAYLALGGENFWEDDE